MVIQLTESTASADWLRERRTLSKGRGFSDFMHTVVPNAKVDNGVLAAGRLSNYGTIQILNKDEPNAPKLVIAGYASPQVVDREKHVITKEALARDLPRFMAVPEYRNANLLHSNVQVAKVIPSYITPDGKRYDTKVDDIGLFVVVEVRTDPAAPKICLKVAADIRSGKLQAFSISADAPYESRRYECSNGTCFWVIDAVELYEITICETPVNQDAKFTLLTKSFDLGGEFAPYMWCKDGSCPVSIRQAKRALQKSRQDGWIETKLDFGFGATEFSTRREHGTMDDAKRSQLGAAAAAGEKLGSTPQNPLDLDVSPWPARSGMKGRQPISFEEAFDLAYADPSGRALLDSINRAAYNMPDTIDDEEQYLNEPTAYLATEPEGVEADVDGDVYGPDVDVKLNGTAEHFHLSLKRDLGQLSEGEAVRLAQLDKDNEASGFPPDSGYGQVIIGTDHPNEPVLQGRAKQPRLQPAVSGTPSIMRSLDDALGEAAMLRLSEPVAAPLHQARLALADGNWPFEWDDSERLFKTAGCWTVPGSAFTATALVTMLRNAAHEQNNGRAVESLGMIYRQISRAQPLTPAQAGGIALALAQRAGDSTLTKAASPEVALKRVRDGVSKIVRSPDARMKVPPRLLASLDSILEEAEGAIDGLQLGLTLGLGETKLSMRDPKVRYRPMESPTERCGVCRHMRDDSSCALVQGMVKADMVCNLFSHGDPEHEVIENAGAGNTLRDVEKTDALLESVSKAMAPQPTQDEVEAGLKQDAQQPEHTGAMIAFFPTSGTQRQFAQEGGEPADEIHLTLVYLGKADDFTPEQQRTILAIAKRHADASPPIECEVTSIGHFPPSASSDGKKPIIAHVSGDDLHPFRRELVADLKAHGIKFPETFKNYVPHITLRYDAPGMDDMQERGIPEVESTPFHVDRLHVVFAGKKTEFSMDSGGMTQISGKDPGEERQRILHNGDEDALAYGALFGRMWNRGFRDPSYKLAVMKADGTVLNLDG